MRTLVSFVMADGMGLVFICYDGWGWDPLFHLLCRDRMGLSFFFTWFFHFLCRDGMGLLRCDGMGGDSFLLIIAIWG